MPNTPPMLDGQARYRGRLGCPYHPHPDLIGAANAALVLGAPLLLTGEPGCGKTDFAWAAASALGARFQLPAPPLLECYVRSDSKARDFLYTYDAVRRFGDAQHGGEAGQRRAQDARHYIELQALGRALLSPRCVVLIDEIDKAPRDLPNDLLRELDQGRFEIPEIAGEIAGEVCSHGHPLRREMGGAEGERPLVIITSNVERQLPDAFLRRCVFFHIPFPEDEALRTILLDHFGGQGLAGDRPYLDGVLGVFQALREFRPRLAKRPATAELLAWVQALGGAFPAGEARRRLMAAWAGRDRGGAPRFGEVPALGCLIKLREDLDRVTARR